MTVLALVAAREMGPAAWVFLVLTWGAVIAMNLFCFVKILSGKRRSGAGGPVTPTP